NVWTSRAVIVRLRIASLRDLLHTPHFPGGESDLDAARVEGGCREDVFHNATSKLPGALILLLRDVHLQPWLDVFAVLPMHACASFTFSRWRRCRRLFHSTYRGTRVAICSGVTVMSTRGSVCQRAT